MVGVGVEKGEREEAVVASFPLCCHCRQLISSDHDHASENQTLCKCTIMISR